jgi:3'(2'), 5'-bisphosphate nucleotidase
MNLFSPQQAQQIHQAIRQAGQEAARLSAQQFEVSQKGPDDFVTSVDRALDRQLAQQFGSWFPEDGIVTEENTRSQQTFHHPYRRFWFIDPIDGTDDFIQGRPDYSVMVGLLQDHQPVAGWVYAPTEDCLYFGGPHWGLFKALGEQPPQPLIATPPAEPSADFCPVLIGYKDQRHYGQALRQLIPEAQLYSLGSFGLKVVEVIQGRAGLYLYLNGRVKLWDTTGPIALAQAAGLACCDVAGNPLSFTPDAIHPQTLAHYQPILIGWPHYIEQLRPRIVEAIALVTA